MLLNDTCHSYLENVLQLFCSKAPKFPMPCRGNFKFVQEVNNHRHTHLPLCAIYTISLSSTQKCFIRHRTVELLMFTSWTPHGSPCREHPPTRTVGLSVSFDSGTSLTGGLHGPTGRKCAQSAPSIDAWLREGGRGSGTRAMWKEVEGKDISRQGLSGRKRSRPEGRGQRRIRTGEKKELGKS